MGDQSRWCRCGKRIHVAIRWNGLDYILIHQDPRDEYREITHCPRCGEWLKPGSTYCRIEAENMGIDIDLD